VTPQPNRPKISRPNTTRPSTNWRRALAQQVLRHGALLLPPERSSWANVMQREAEYIDDDREALRWAWGSVRAGLAERLWALRSSEILSARAIGALWIGTFIFSSAFNVSITLAARLRYQGVASTLGLLLHGYHYERFVPLADAMPPALFVLMGLVVVLFAASLVLRIRNSRAAYGTFCSAVGLSLGAWLYQLGIPAYVEAMPAPHRWRIGICFALTAGVLVALRLGGAAPNRNVASDGDVVSDEEAASSRRVNGSPP
jgi:hypothetical protein